MRPVTWLGDSLDRVRQFPAEARQKAGYQLELVQAGREPVDSKPMTAIGPGVHELRIRAGGAFRVLYLARLAEAVYVLHAFQKKTRKTSHLDIEVARRRLRAFLQERF